MIDIPPRSIYIAAAMLFSSFACLADTAAAQAQPGFASMLPTLAFMMIIFYFLLIRPQQKKAKEQAALLSSVRTGDEVVTSGGLHGIVSNARDPESKTVLVKFAENVKIEVDKSAIVNVTKAGASASDDARAAIPAGKTI